MPSEPVIHRHLVTAKERLAGRRGVEVEKQRLIAAHLETRAEREQAGAENIIRAETKAGVPADKGTT